MKYVLALFSPALIAIAVRIVLFILCWLFEQLDISYLYYLLDFEAFIWDDSYGYWSIVIILTFVAEMYIFSGELDD
ncbi:hypothetical protein M2137_001474 [Parabacteroides sp. PFB2-10]|nr:hypothetical protein [Parabacteroides sp. PFB2-10]